MSKAAVVIEKPESCDKCPFNHGKCCAKSRAGRIIRKLVTEKIPKWCPLRPVKKLIPQDKTRPYRKMSVIIESEELIKWQEH